MTYWFALEWKRTCLFSVLMDDQNFLVTKDFKTDGFVEDLHAYRVREQNVFFVCQELRTFLFTDHLTYKYHMVLKNHICTLFQCIVLCMKICNHLELCCGAQKLQLFSQLNRYLTACCFSACSSLVYERNFKNVCQVTKFMSYVHNLP